MQENFNSTHGNPQEDGGKLGAIIIPFSLCKKIECVIENAEMECSLVEEKVVLSKFHISKKTLQNQLRRLRSCYTIAFNGSRWWNLKKLLFFKNVQHIFSRKKIA